MKRTKAQKGIDSHSHTFKIKNGKKSTYEIRTDSIAGSFIEETSGIDSYQRLGKVIKQGLSYASVLPLIRFLELSNREVALLAGLSERTVSRWRGDTNIGALPSKNLIRIDSITRKGSRIFGSSEEFKSWLYKSNEVFGNKTPISILTDPYGVEFINDALDALEFGNVM